MTDRQSIEQGQLVKTVRQLCDLAVGHCKADQTGQVPNLLRHKGEISTAKGQILKVSCPYILPAGREGSQVILACMQIPDGWQLPYASRYLPQSVEGDKQLNEAGHLLKPGW